MRRKLLENDYDDGSGENRGKDEKRNCEGEQSTDNFYEYAEANPLVSQAEFQEDDDSCPSCHKDICSSDSDDSSVASADHASESEDDMGAIPPSPSVHSGASSNHSASEGNYDSDDSASSADSAASLDYLYEGSDMTSNEGLLRVLKIFVEEGWSKTSLDKNVKLLKRMLPKPNDLPSSGKAALKRLENLTATFSEKEHVYCTECLQLVVNGENQENDEKCKCEGEQNTDKFYSFDPEDQIRHMFQQRGLASVIDYHRDHHNRQEGFICDVQDGSEYKAIKEHLRGPHDIVCMWNTDGLQLSSSSKQELWAILGTICEVPPRLRSSFLIVFGVYVGNKDPDMNVFLKPFVESLKKIQDKGGLSWIHPVSKEQMLSQVVAPVLVADAPAKALVCHHKRFNSRFGCNICEQKARLVDPEEEENPDQNLQQNPRKRKRRQRRYLYQEDVDPAPLRSGARMDLQGELAAIRAKSRKGVRGKAVISASPFLDRASCVAAEYLHLILLGVVRYLLLKMFFKTGGAWYIGDKIDELDIEISKIKVPDFVKRLPRKIKDIKYWKASEFRNFLLFYSLPLFRDRLPKLYFQHWLLLVEAVYILLKDAISENDLCAAEIMLRSFVRDVGSLYGDLCYTYNMHNLLHVCLLVRRWGNLWSTSAFIFESFNGYISSHIHGTKHLGKEFVNHVKITQSVAILENIVNAHPAGFSQTNIPTITEFLGKPISVLSLDNIQQAALIQANLGVFELHIRAKIKSVIYTSKIYDQNYKRANSFIQFHDQSNDDVSFQYGEILVFVRGANGGLWCLVKVFKIVHVDLFVHEKSRYIIRHLLPVSESETLLVLPVHQIVTKVLKVGSYLGLRPNSYEVNL